MNQNGHSGQNLRSVLQDAIAEMMAKGILWTEAVAEFEKLFIEEALRRHQGCLIKAAQTLGVHRNTLSKKMREYHLSKGRKNKSSSPAVESSKLD
jgi:DNA-binding NtrC family response regulator